MSRPEKTRAEIRSRCESLRGRVVALLAGFGTDRTGSTAIEYALMLAGIALGGSGLTAAIGVDLASIFGSIELELCKQLYSLCIAR